MIAIALGDVGFAFGAHDVVDEVDDDAAVVVGRVGDDWGGFAGFLVLLFFGELVFVFAFGQGGAFASGALGGLVDDGFCEFEEFERVAGEATAGELGVESKEETVKMAAEEDFVGFVQGGTRIVVFEKGGDGIGLGVDFVKAVLLGEPLAEASG